MIYAKKQTIVAEETTHSWIKSELGDSVHVVDAKSWLADIRRLKTTGHVGISEYLTSDILAIVGIRDSPLIRELEAQSEEFHLPFRCFDKEARRNLIQWIVQTAMDQASSAWAYAAESHHKAAMLRQDLDIQQRSFQALEAAVHESGIPQFSLALDIPLASGALILAGEECLLAPDSPHPVVVATLFQRMPLSARRIASVDLNCERLTDYSETGSLTISVIDLAGNHLESTAPIPLSDLSCGWNHFNLARGINCSDRDAVLKLSLLGAGALRFRLGPCVPIDRFHPQSGGSEAISDAPLAMKVWRGFAGVRTPASHLKISQGGIVRREASEMPKARLHATDDPSMGFEPVQYWPKEDGFLVHPPKIGMTVGIIEGLDIKNLTSVTAIVNNNHREAPTVSFAVGFVPSGCFFHVPDVLGTWLQLPPLGWGEVHVPLPQPYTGKFDLLVASLVAEGQGNHMAWALFRAFILHTLSE